MDEELLTVPDIVKVNTGLLGVLDTSGVTAGDEVSDATVDTRRGVPHDLSGATVVHGRWPHGENSVFRGEGSVREESSVLLHAVIERNVVVLAPATERVEEEDGVSVASGNELLTGVLEEENVTVVERVSHLESVDNIGVLLNNLGLDLRRQKSVFIVAIVEDGSLDEAHGLSGHEEVTLGEDSLGLGVVLGHAAEGASADFLLAVVEEDRVVDDSKDGVGADSSAFDGDLGGASEGLLLLSSDRLGDGNREKLAFAVLVSDGLHVDDLEELELVHEAVERGGPAVTNSLEVLNLVLVDVQNWEASGLGSFSLRSGAPERLSNLTLLVVAENALALHVVDDHRLAGLEREGTSVNIEGRVLRSLIRGRDTSEVGDDTITSLLVKTLDITTLTDLKRGADMALVEFKASGLMYGLSEISVSSVR